MIAGILLAVALGSAQLGSAGAGGVPMAGPTEDPAPPIAEKEDAVRKAPADPRAHLDLGIAYANAEEYELAMAELVEAIRLNPDDQENLSARANFHLGNVLLALDRPALAVTAYREALRLGWTDAGVYLAMGQALSSQGKYQEAIAEYQQALRLAPGTLEAHAGIGLALEATGRLEEAATHYELYLQAAPSTEDHEVAAIKQRLAKLKERRRL